MNEYKFEDLEIGTKCEFTALVTADMLDNFFKISGDCNPLHMDETYSINQGFEHKVVYGMLTASFYSTLAGVYLPGKYCILKELSTSFYRPVYIGDELTISGIVYEKNYDFNCALINAKIVNQLGKRVSKARITAGFYGK